MNNLYYLELIKKHSSEISKLRTISLSSEDFFIQLSIVKNLKKQIDDFVKNIPRCTLDIKF